MSTSAKSNRAYIGISLALLFITGGLIYAGWQAYSSAFKVDTVENEGLSETVETPPDDWISFTTPDNKATFAHPPGWKTTSVDDGSPEIRVAAPTGTNGEEGSKDVFAIIYHEGNGNEKIDGIIYGTDPISVYTSEIEVITVNGRRALCFGLVQGDKSIYTTLVVADGGYYTIDYLNAPNTDGETNIATAQYFDEYVELVNSFET